MRQTILILGTFVGLGRQKIHSEDEIITMVNAPQGIRLNKVSLGNGGSANMRLCHRPQAPTYEKIRPSHIRRDRPNEAWSSSHTTAVSSTPADAVQWNKELLRSMVMDEAEYEAIHRTQ